MSKENAEIQKKPKHPEETPPMLVNEVSRLFMRVVKRNDGTGQDKHPTREQHSARLMLMFLSKHDGMTQSDLVKATRMQAPTISIALRNMEDEGLVERIADETDRRITRVYITEKGRRIDGQNLARLKAVDEIMMEGVTDSESEAMLAVLHKMRENLKKELNITDEAD